MVAVVFLGGWGCDGIFGFVKPPQIKAQCLCSVQARIEARPRTPPPKKHSSNRSLPPLQGNLHETDADQCLTNVDQCPSTSPPLRVQKVFHLWPRGGMHLYEGVKGVYHNWRFTFFGVNLMEGVEGSAWEAYMLFPTTRRRCGLPTHNGRDPPGSVHPSRPLATFHNLYGCTR